MSERDIHAARAEAEAAKARLLGTAHELQERLAPGNIANTMIDVVREKSQGAADGAARAVRARPLAAAAAAAGLVALIARKPIAALINRIRGSENSSGDEQ